MFFVSDRSGYAARREVRSFRAIEKKWRVSPSSGKAIAQMRYYNPSTYAEKG